MKEEKAGTCSCKKKKGKRQWRLRMLFENNRKNDRGKEREVGRQKKLKFDPFEAVASACPLKPSLSEATN